MKNIRLFFGVIPILLIILFTSCDENYTKTPFKDEVLDGPLDGLSHEESARFLSGDAAFNQVFTRETGLGPTFVSTSCISCHAGNGKGHPSTALTRFGQIDERGNLFLNLGGPILQNRALPGFLPEQIPFGATSARFIPSVNTGLGFLESVTDADILAMADPNDSDGDGISGVPNWINIPDFVIPSSSAISQDGKYIGRFGKKAATRSLLQQTVNALNEDIGITSIFNPVDTHTHLEIDPEIATSTVNDIVSYLQTLKAPIQRNQNDASVIKGAAIFEQIKCTGCHKPELRTGYSPISALSNKTFAPYTDLLLHDMGSGLDDGYTEGSAKTQEWRTPPLWGIGLSESSQGGSFYLLHDGRARSIEEAILKHGGEAKSRKVSYINLSQPDKEALLTFIKSL
ncbi:di-heme oxidoredictase family protein [Flavobacterium psychrotolerans]|uniref:Thiol oxidoreductase n=1 Tax=Flavobacterium psychrotolerans TaxID=2169410 RepID=A0A2U1JNL5_9FLAO|nr:di-heme oxidoredictase family protein [Flavobacterium psychrotolerans]PWA06585.1 thiol oxidoreductase [Flavobacterium psychrotolerans]